MIRSSAMALGNTLATFPFRRTALVCLSILLAMSCLATAQPTLLSFACEGKVTDAMTGEKGQPVHNMGFVVNLAERTVSFGGYVAPFKKVDAANIYFNGVNQSGFADDVTR
jgi:hypothetical protein